MATHFLISAYAKSAHPTRNDVTVSLFFNQSSQNFDLFLEMKISTSAQNFSRIQYFKLPWQHIL